MKKALFAAAIALTALVVGCDDNCDGDLIKNPSALDSSFVMIQTEEGVIYSSSFHPCDVIGSSSTWINHPDTSLYQPIVVMQAPFDFNSDFLFNIYFKNSDIPVDIDPGINELYDMLTKALETGFNLEPHAGDIIFYIRKDGKRYSNSWDPESAGIASPPYIRDRTGLDVVVSGFEIVENDCRSSGPFPAIRLALIVDGFLVTSDLSDCLRIHGVLDFLMSTSVF